MTVPTDDDLNARAARVLAGGATHVARSYRPAIHVERARGARKWLVDGRELVDYTMGHGALLLGHSLPAVAASALRAGDIAALILEASGARFGWLPLPPEHVLEAARLCGEAGTLLVVDEVVTGFRVGRDGMQGRLGVRADLSAFAKVVAGGLPGGAVGGRADVMDLLAVPDDETGERFVSHPGTFNANPLSAAAGIAALDAIESLGARTRAEAFAAALEEAWGGEIAAAGLGGRVWRLSSIVHLSLDDPAADARLGIRMRQEGVDCLR